jgi:hypothetical protein
MYINIPHHCQPPRHRKHACGWLAAQLAKFGEPKIWNREREKIEHNMKILLERSFLIK